MKKVLKKIRKIVSNFRLYKEIKKSLLIPIYIKFFLLHLLKKHMNLLTIMKKKKYVIILYFTHLNVEKLGMVIPEQFWIIC